MSTAPVSQLAEQSSKVEVRFGTTQPQRRLTVLFRLILVIPQAIVLIFVGIGAFFVVIVGWFAALFTGRLPQSIAGFLLGYVRWYARVSAYANLMVDRYPPFTVESDPTYPVDVSVTTGRLNRAAVLFRIVLVIPASIVSSVLGYGIMAIGVVTWIVTLIVGRMPDAFFGATAAAIRYQSRVTAYFYMLTSYYPGDLFGDKDLYGIAVESPVSGTVDAPPAAPTPYEYGGYGPYGGYGQYGGYASYGPAPEWGSAPPPPPPPGAYPAPSAPFAPGASPWGSGLPGVSAPMPPPTPVEPMPPAATPYPPTPDQGAAPHVVEPTVPPPVYPSAAPPPPPPTYPSATEPPPPPPPPVYPAYPVTPPPPAPPPTYPTSPGSVPPPYPGAMPPIAAGPTGYPQFRSGSFWPLVLSKGARALVVIVIVVGSLTYVVSQVALNRFGQNLTQTLARHQVQTAYSDVSSATDTFKTQRQACLTRGGTTELSCLEQADRDWASAIETYESDLSVVVYPVSAQPAAQDSRYAATEAVGAVTSLANSPTLQAHATDFQSPGFRATINNVDSTYHTLNQALGG